MRRCTTHALYRSKLWQEDHSQHPQNASPDGSTLEGTAQRIGRPFRGGGAEISSEGHIMPPHIFEVCLKVNSNVYLDVLKSVVIPWCNQVVVVLRLWTLLSLTPSSPDLNPLDYFVWSYVENINMISHNTKTSLIAAIRRVFAELPPALVEKACSQFRIRIEAVIETEGGYIEQMSALPHNQVTWIDFFNKSFKIKLLCCFL